MEVTGFLVRGRQGPMISEQRSTPHELGLDLAELRRLRSDLFEREETLVERRRDLGGFLPPGLVQLVILKR